MKSLLKDDKAVIETIAMGLAILVLSIIIVAVFYPIAGSIDTTGIDAEFGGVNETPSANATESVLDVAATVFELNPLVALVAIASAIIMLVMGMVYINRRGGAGL